MAEESSSVEVQFSRELGTGRAVSRALALLLAAFLFSLHGSVVAAGGVRSVGSQVAKEIHRDRYWFTVLLTVALGFLRIVDDDNRA